MGLHVVIMAGGSGTRFWPLSRRARPKQLLPLWKGRTLIALTVERLARLVPHRDIHIVTGSHLADAVAAATPELDRANIIVEPAARNTLPCILLAAEVVRQRDPDGVLAVFPADAFIGDVDAFVAACQAAHQTADQAGYIVTLGIQPSRPETGYGYIRRTGNRLLEAAAGGDVFEVDAFVEKPDAERAVEYLADGTYLWNAGIFFMSLAALDREMGRQQPDARAACQQLGGAWASGDASSLAAAFGQLPKTSVDYGIMERAEKVAVVPCELGWSDVGQWAALREVLTPDADGNIVDGRVLALDCKDSVLVNRSSRSNGKVLAAVGLEGLVVVETDDAILVMPAADSQRVRELVAKVGDELR